MVDHCQPLLTCRILKQGSVLLTRLILTLHQFINVSMWFGTNIKGVKIGQTVQKPVIIT